MIRIMTSAVDQNLSDRHMSITKSSMRFITVTSMFYNCGTGSKVPIVRELRSRENR
jgi:hypothetical protein